MSEDVERDSKTEEPTEKRLSDAIEKGNVPLAREATLFGSMAAIYAALVLLGGWATVHLTNVLRTAFVNAGILRIDDREGAAHHILDLIRDVGTPLLPVMAIIAAGSIVASLVQNVPTMAGERIAPKSSRISPGSGWNRLFGSAGWVEFGKSVLKIGIVSVILWILFERDVKRLVASLHMEPGFLPATLQEMSTGILIPMLGLSLFLAVADLAWSRMRWRRDLRMTRQEVKDEMKEAEGDPFVKSRIRGLARQRNSRRMLDKLPQASVVITNPTHYAVALLYDRTQGGAPIVVAKGIDHMAKRIREIASHHEVPLVENKPLARGLYDHVDIDMEIPPEFYRAVAEIIQFLNNTRRPPGYSRKH